MSLQETCSYIVEITLSTENGELPSPEEVELLINTQMGGELDEETGLMCISTVLTHVCSNCGAPVGIPCDHDGGCIDADRG